MTAKKATHEMLHKRQYMSVGGKLKHIPAGTHVTLTTAQAEALEGRVKPIGDEKTIDLTEGEAKKKAAAEAKKKAQAEKKAKTEADKKAKDEAAAKAAEDSKSK